MPMQPPPGFEAGVIASINHLFHIGLPPWAIQNAVDFQLSQAEEVARRRDEAGI